MCDADNEDGVAAAATAAHINGRFRRLHCPRSRIKTHQRRSRSACRHSCICTYRHPPAWTVLKHQVSCGTEKFVARRGFVLFWSYGIRLFSCIISACMLYYCNTVRWAWLDWGLSGWLTTLLQCFDTVGWVIRPVKTVGRITYIVLVQTLNHAQSINTALKDHYEWIVRSTVLNPENLVKVTWMSEGKQWMETK